MVVWRYLAVLSLTLEHNHKHAYTKFQRRWAKKKVPIKQEILMIIIVIVDGFFRCVLFYHIFQVCVHIEHTHTHRWMRPCSRFIRFFFLLFFGHLLKRLFHLFYHQDSFVQVVACSYSKWSNESFRFILWLRFATSTWNLLILQCPVAEVEKKMQIKNSWFPFNVRSSRVNRQVATDSE